MASTDESLPVVLILDDDEGIRDVLQALLATARIPARSFASPVEFLDHCNADTRGCALIDVWLPSMNGLEVLDALRAKGAFLPVIMMSGSGTAAIGAASIKKGAIDFIEKPLTLQTVLDKIQPLLRAEEARPSHESSHDLRIRLQSLTHREHQILDLVVAGKASKVIAVDLGLSKKTVDNHRSRIMRKLGVRSVTELMSVMMRIGPGNSAA